MNEKPGFEPGSKRKSKVVAKRKYMSTTDQYQKIIQQCEDIFLKKTVDYGTSWRVLRTISVVDQI